MWTDLLPHLVDRFQVIAFDLPGHGDSGARAGRWTHRAAARDVLAAMDRLGLDRVAAVGASSGGMTLLHLATLTPVRVRAMVLIGATTTFGAPAKAVMTAMTPGHPNWAPLRHFHRTDEQCQALQETFHAFKEDVDDMAFTPRDLGAISAETLIVHGDRDALFPVDIATSIYEAIPHSYLWIIPNGNHAPLFDGPADEIMRASGDFLAAAGRS